MRKVWDRITGRDKLKLEIKHLNFQHDVANALVKSLARDAGEQQSRGDALLKALDKARHDRNGYKEMHSAYTKSAERRIRIFENLCSVAVKEILSAISETKRPLNDEDAEFYHELFLLKMDEELKNKVSCHV